MGSDYGFEEWMEETVDEERKIFRYSDVFGEEGLSAERVENYAADLKDMMARLGYSPVEGIEEPEDLTSPRLPREIEVDPGSGGMRQLEKEEVPEQYWLFSQSFEPFIYEKGSDDYVAMYVPKVEKGETARVEFFLPQFWMETEEGFRDSYEDEPEKIAPFLAWEMQQDFVEFLWEEGESDLAETVQDSQQLWESLRREPNSEDYETGWEMFVDYYIEERAEELPDRAESIEVREEINNIIDEVGEALQHGESQRIPDELDDNHNVFTISAVSSVDIETFIQDLHRASEGMDNIRQSFPLEHKF